MNNIKPTLIIVTCALLTFFLLYPATVTYAQVSSHQKISELEGNFTGTLAVNDLFGWSPYDIGDLDGDGVVDLAVGSPGDTNGTGAVWILFLNADGTVKSDLKINETGGGFTGDLDINDHFGHSIAAIGDFDGDGVQDLAVGALNDDDGGTNRGAIWLLFLNTDGTVKAHQKISDTEGGFTDTLIDNDGFGHGITRMGDFDGDGVVDLAAATGHINYQGVIWLLFMNADGTVRDFQRITDSFTGSLDPDAELGHDIDFLGDLDGDGVTDLVAGVRRDSTACSLCGAFFVIFLNADGTVKNQVKITEGLGGFTGDLDGGDVFGHPVVNAGDLDGDGVNDVLSGAPFDDDGGSDVGAFWILYLNADGTVKVHEKISQTQGGFTGDLDDNDLFSHIVGTVGDLDGNGVTDFIVGAPHDDDGGDDKGAVWVLFSDVGANLDVTQSDDADPVIEGEDITYIIKVNNIGPDTAVDVILTDILPIGVSYISATPGQGSCSEANLVVTCNLVDINSGGSVNVTIVVTATTAGVLTNTVSATSVTPDPNPDNNSASEETTVTPFGQIIDNLDAEFTTIGSWNTKNNSLYNPFNNEFRYANSGDGSAQAIFTPVITTPGDYEVSIWPLASTRGATNTPVTVTHNGGSTMFPVNQLGDPTSGGGWLNLGVFSFVTGASGSIVISNDADGIVMADAVRVVFIGPSQPGANLAVTQSDDVDPVIEGEDITYTINVSNIGPDTAVDVILTDDLPTGVSYISATPSQGSCSEANLVVTCNLVDINSGDSVDVTIVVNATTAGVLTNTVSATSVTPDPNPGNNSASEETTVTPSGQIVVIIIDNLLCGNRSRA